MECIVLQFILGYNNITDETRILYRCQGEKVFRYLKPPRPHMDIAKGIYSIESNVIILDEPFGV